MSPHKLIHFIPSLAVLLMLVAPFPANAAPATESPPTADAGAHDPGCEVASFQDDCTGLFVVFGEIFMPDGVTHYEDGRVVAVTNTRTQATAEALLGDAEPGKYEAVFIDYTGNCAAMPGDEIRISVQGGIIRHPIHSVTLEETGNSGTQWTITLEAAIPISVPGVGGSTRLHANHPNPFNPRTRLSFSLGQPGVARLALYDLKGRCISGLIDQWLPAGDHETTWDGHDSAGRPVSSGVYLLRLETREGGFSRTITLAK